MNKNKGFTLVELLASMALLTLIVVMVFTIFGQSTKVWRKAGARVDQYSAARIVLEQIARELRGAVVTPEGGFAVPDDSPSVKAKGCMPFVVLHAGDNNDNALQGWRDSNGKEKEQKFSDQIYFVAPVENSNKQDYCMIGYWVRDAADDTNAQSYNRNTRSFQNIDNHKDDVLMRYYVTDGGQITPDVNWLKMNFALPKGAANSNEFALNVKSIRIRCWSDYPDSNEYTTIWEDEKKSPAQLPNVEAKINWDSSLMTDFLDFGAYDDSKLPNAVKITIVVQDQNSTEKEREFSRVVYLDNATR